MYGYICPGKSLRGFVGGWKFVMNVTARGIKYRELSKLW
jgi:hypothetical protein